MSAVASRPAGSDVAREKQTGSAKLWRGAAVVAGLIVLLLVPLSLSSATVGLLSNMLIAALFAMSFNLLYGQAGMLSFGHSAYFGIGTFAAIHAMRAADAGTLAIPVPLIPLAAGLVAMVVGYLVGLVATRRTGVYFSLITVAFAEIVLSIATPFDFLFGGEGGLSAWRPSWLGIEFATSAEVYYLVLFWCALCTLALWHLTGTPLGRAAVAIRENDERLSFLGYNVNQTKTIIFSLSAMFAGVAGGLTALDRESANYLVFSGAVSAEVVLNAFIGGVGVFLGPAIGAAIMTLGGNLVSGISRSWVLYQGVLFVLVVMYLPQGIAGLVRGQWHAIRQHGLRRLLPPWIMFGLGAALTGVAIVLPVEIAHALFGDMQGTRGLVASGLARKVQVFSVSWDPTSLVTWLVVGLCLAAGISLLRAGRRRVAALAQAQPVGEA